MNRQKVAVVLIGVAVIATVIVFQLRRPGGAPPTAPATAEITAPERPAESVEPARQPSNTASVSIPATGWGRNPFLTAAEINSLNAPLVEEAAAAEVPAVVVPAARPQHDLTAIVANPDAALAVIGTRVVRVGDRLGPETVKEIKTRSVVLESQGETREISLDSPVFDIQPGVPGGELQ
jgi:hypothetical protein